MGSPSDSFPQETGSVKYLLSSRYTCITLKYNVCVELFRPAFGHNGFAAPV